ncbi:L-dopachrome tautomerase-related protein [Ascidiimonas sp. W6]|uniref:L-dopachrome tautomerase-related protein n=1 Tax=Ascidiimonas meishanensis TaxID=3128903 RepID=UPI0030EB5A84
MKKLSILLFFILLISCKNKDLKKEIQENLPAAIKETEPILVASFEGQQVTGVTVTKEGQLFANFPRWREGVRHSVVEVGAGETRPYPNESWNNWKLGDTLQDSVFVAVQSVVASNHKLYVLDTRNPLFQGVQGAPRVFTFDLYTNTLERTYVFSEESFHSDSYINDLRIDVAHKHAYFTDSGHAGLVILDLESGKTKRVLDNHTSTLAETNQLIIDGKPWKNTVHSDGIALDTENGLLYYHALTGYNLYAVPVKTLLEGTDQEIEKSVQLIQKTPAPDGMIFDAKGNLYLADLEQHKILSLDTSGNLNVIASGENVRWVDTFSIYNGELYYTNSRIHEAKANVSDLTFTIYKVNIN